MFGENIQLNYKGENAYATYFGTFCSIIVIVLISVHLIEIGTNYLDSGNVSLSYSQSYFNRLESEPFNLGENGVEVVVFPLLGYEPEIYKWKVFQLEPYKDGYKRSETKEEMEKDEYRANGTFFNDMISRRSLDLNECSEETNE